LNTNSRELTKLRSLWVVQDTTRPGWQYADELS